MLRSRSRRPNYHLAWQLVEQLLEEENLTAQEIKLRQTLRRIQNPMNVSELDFMKRFRLSKEAFHYLCGMLSEKTNLKGTTRVSFEQKVLSALSFFAHGSYQKHVGEARNLGQTTVSKYLEEVVDALINSNIVDEIVRFPLTRPERDLIKQEFYTQYGIPGVVGAIDGSHFKIFTPTSEREHLFFCRKNYYSLNVQMICDIHCRITNVNAKFGGATHDAFIWQDTAVNEFMQGLHRDNEVVWLLGDSGYPQRPWMMTPIQHAAEGSPEAKYTTMHGKARVTIENTFGRLKNRWRCVGKDRTLHYSPEKCAKIVIACAVLHNIAINFRLPDPEREDTSRTENPNNHGFTRNEVLMEDGSARDDLTRGRALRAQLVSRLNRLH